MDHWLTNILVLTLWLECRGEDRVNQTREDVSASEGHTVSLQCTFQTTDTNLYLFWYKQEINDFPRFILSCVSYGEGVNAAEFQRDRFDAQIQNTSVPLRIQKLQLSDSALYYCALRRTGAQKIVFGSGTSLTVELEVNSQPSYYELSKPNGTNVCLALGFTSWNGTAETGGDVFENMTEASRAPDEAFYSQVAVDRSCPEGSDVSCTDTFHPDEKVNFLSLIMLGLRILVLKAVVFNVLMTLRLWLH